MKIRRFTARTSRDALRLLREALGDDAVVLSTKPCAEGVEVLAMAPEGMQQIERAAEESAALRPVLPPAVRQPRAAPVEARAAPAFRQPAAELQPRAALAERSTIRAQQRTEPTFSDSAAPAPRQAAVEQDVEQLAMSTLSFQDFVRDRMLRKRELAIQAEQAAAQSYAGTSVTQDVERLSASTLSFQDYARDRMLKRREAQAEAETPLQAAPARRPAALGPLSTRMAQLPGAGETSARASAAPPREPPVLRDEVPAAAPVAASARAVRSPLRSEIHVPLSADGGSARRDQLDMMNELKSMKGLIEERFGALAFMEKLQRQPGQARLTQKLLECGFTPALIRKLAEGLSPDTNDENGWAAGVLERNLHCGDTAPALEDQGGVLALIGSTGVGKTTTTAKIAAAFASKHGAANLGLITLDAYRVAAHEQLRAYGRILRVPVHTAHDRASLEDLLELLSGKQMVLIDTAGMAQRDSRTRELLDMLSHRSIEKLLVVNAAAQGETIEDVLLSYGAASAKGVVLSKIDEAVKLGPALDAMIRHKLTVLGVANGQRVPEDWHRLSAQALVHRALRVSTGGAFRLDASDVNLIFAAPHASLYASTSASTSAGAQA